MIRCGLLCILLGLLVTWCSANELNVRHFGAKGDGRQLETTFLQQAIDRAGEAGGVVVFPSGTYLSGTLYLRSNVTLRFEKGATLLGSTALQDYPENSPDYTFFRKGTIKRALIYAEGCKNITLEGEGTVDGQGAAFKEPTEKGVSSYSVRPYVIWMIQCTNIRVQGLRLQNSALWMQHYMACEKIFIHDIDVYNHSNKNNDMMDIDGCRDVIISDCRGDTDDDGITLKSTHAQPNENIAISNCIISSHCNAIKCGTESNAGFKNITISNCVIRPSRDREVIYGMPDGISGISLEVVDGAEMRGINISNIVMDGPMVPIFVRLGHRARGYDPDLPKPGVGSIEDVRLSNITARRAGSIGCSITGIPNHAVKNISLRDVRISYVGGGTQKQAQRKIDEQVRDYPEATMFGPLPSYGFFVRHVEGLSMANIELTVDRPDERSPFYLEDISDGYCKDVRADTEEEVSMIQATQIHDLFLERVQPRSSAKYLVELFGDPQGSIYPHAIDSTRFLTLLHLVSPPKKKKRK